jgi:PrtD family type I secretion system ABC transporter
MQKQSRETGQALKVLRKALHTCYRRFVFVVFFSFFINLLLFVQPIYMLQVYDRVLLSRSEPTLLALTALAGGLLIIMAMLDAVRTLVLVRTGAYLDHAMGSTVFSAIFQRSLAYPTVENAQPLRDLETVRDMLANPGLVAFIDAPWVPFFMAAVFLLHPLLGLVAAGGAVAILALALINALWSRSPLRDAGLAGIKANAYAVKSMRNADVVEAMGMEPGVRACWHERHGQALTWQTRASSRIGVITAVSKAMRMFLQVAMLGTGAYLAMKQMISPGTMIAASILMGRALAPVEQGVGQWRAVMNARAAYSRMRTALAEARVDEHRMALPAPKGKLTVSKLAVAPPGKTDMTLKGVSFSLNPGQNLGVIGPSGSGKSTLARTLVGVWTPLHGTVRLDGVEMAQWPKQDLGPYLGYVPQDVDMLEGTVAENIARFGRINAEGVVAAARLAGIHEMILTLPDGYDTVIGTSGHGLSGGQRQRIGLARALYGNPRLLVLDEPSAGLDTESEVALVQTFKALKEAGQTVVVMTHRPPLVQVSDAILVLKDGQMESVGPRDEVFAKFVRSGPSPVAATPDLPAKRPG